MKATGESRAAAAGGVTLGGDEVLSETGANTRHCDVTSAVDDVHIHVYTID